MYNIFNFVKNRLLKEMPSGLLVTKDDINFDLGNWQHKTFKDNENIYNNLKNKWCSTVINLLIFDDINEKQLNNFYKEIDFVKKGRYIYLIYFIAIKRNSINDKIKDILSNNILNINRFKNCIIFENYYIFINDFIMELLYY